MALSFRALGFPIELRLSFPVVAVGLGWLVTASWTGTIAFAMLLFASVLVHELGHALSAQAFGLTPRIVLYALGGATAWTPSEPLGRKPRIVVAVAGPLAGLVLGLLAYLIYTQAGHWPRVEALSLELALINWGLSFINLMPIQPFDGGHVLAAALGPERRMLAARVSAVFGIAVAVVLAQFGLWVGAAVFFASALMTLTARSHAETAYGQVEITGTALDGLLQRARRALDADEFEQARAIATVVLRTGPSNPMRRRCLEIVAWAALGEGSPSAAEEALARVPRSEVSEVDGYLRGALAEAAGDRVTAVRVLRAALESGDQRPSVLALLVRVHLEQREFELAARAARSLIGVVDPEEIRRVSRECRQGAAPSAAAALSWGLFSITGVARDALEAAVGHALGGEVDAAVDALEDARRAGLEDPASVLGPADLAILEGHARLAALLASSGAEP